MAKRNSPYFLIFFLFIALNFIYSIATDHNSDDANTAKWLPIWPFIPPTPHSSTGHFPKFPFTRSIFPWPWVSPPYSPNTEKSSGDISPENSQNMLGKKSCSSIIDRCIICVGGRCSISYDCCEVVTEFGHEECNKLYEYAMIKNMCAISPLAAPPPTA
ncbi:hypothetical protein HAX54_016375 [Datura stramonium]|uniref:Uncharacterized protein n=1 Tax=Datura stramonium TaxID=4076 RepID=A0ABS8S2B1_DATST|nr:hypothetical protein [Datura stramonium]